MAGDGSAHLDIFRRLRSSALAFWAKVRLSASARLSTAMARKTLRRISGRTVLRTWTWFLAGGCGQSHPWSPGCPQKPSWSLALVITLAGDNPNQHPPLVSTEL